MHNSIRECGAGRKVGQRAEKAASLRRSALAVVLSAAFSTGVFAADTTIVTDDGNTTLQVTSGGGVLGQPGLNVFGDSTAGAAPVIRAIDTSTFTGVEVDGGNAQVNILGPGGGTTSIGTVSSNIAGDVTVDGGLQVTGVGVAPGSPALDVTGNAVVAGNTALTGTLSATGATTLNTGGANTITADGTSARLESGGNSLAVSGTGVAVNATGSVTLNASGAQGSGVVSSVTMTNTTTGVAHGLFVRSTETTLSGGTNSTTITLNDNGMTVSDSNPAVGDTFRVTNAGVATVGNGSLAGTLVVTNGAGGDRARIDGVANTITGSTSTTLTGGSTTLALTNTGAALNANLDMGGTSRITGLANGTAGTDAVNLNQLNSAVSSSSTATNARIDALGQRVDKLEERSYAGIASVAALAAIPAPPPGKRYTIGAGVGTYGGKDAMAIGFRGAVTDRVSVTLGVSHNSVNKTAANAGVGYSW